ncbi:ROK family glucokinase [Salinicoccus halitifaciens]|uniref:Glucokinase n=1 Tax=Salinicoccus halitifaciens TaxID=1073415 RepID=A0ABV2E6L7_9STAP|nr:ROK family glucokinase [Salinicoccus halitifaciens]MCD2136890.1 ROK family glucokinase [Salinicoccus halitifaciens]
MILAADIGGTTCKLGIFDASLKQVEKWQIPTDTSREGSGILEAVHMSFKQKLEESGLGYGDCRGIGIGVPGPVDFSTGIVNGAINLNWRTHKNIRQEFERFSGIPAVVDNDANLAALGEQAFGAGKGHGDVVMLTLGTGVGGGIIAGHHLVHGAHGSAGEIGHMKVAVGENFKCNCGGTGCLESVASTIGLKNLALKYSGDFESSALKTHIEDGSLKAITVFKNAEAGDPLSLFLVDKMSFYLGVGISSLASLTNPSHIIIGGGLSRAGDFLLGRVRTYFEEYAFPPAAEGTEIVPAELGNDAGIYGAAKIVAQYTGHK